MHTSRKSRIVGGAALLVSLLFCSLAIIVQSPHNTDVMAADGCQFFPETNYQVCGRFLEYYWANGGVKQQGYPISNVFNEQNQPPPAGDGQVHSVQYFERARFEYHNEFAPPNDVQLGLLGREQYIKKDPFYIPPGNPNSYTATYPGRTDYYQLPCLLLFGRHVGRS